MHAQTGKMTLRLLFGILLSLAAIRMEAQRGWELGGWAGAAYYFGDLNTSYNLSQPGIAGGLVGRYNFNNRLCLKMGATMGTVQADDARSSNPYEKARNLSFQSKVFDGSTQFEFNFLPYVHGSRTEFFTPYLFTGLSLFSFNPKTRYNGSLVELRPLGTEGQFPGEEYYTFSGAFVYGGGFKFDINPLWSVNIEVTARALFTDYLDDVSTVYPDKKALLRQHGPLSVALSDRSISIPGVDNSQLGNKGTQRGNSNNKDNLVFIQIGIVRYFGNLQCPSWKGKR